MSLWAEYAEEEENKQVYETEHGFFSYQIVGKEMFIRDFFITKSERGTGKGLALGKKMEEIAKERGCNLLSGIIHVDGRPDYQTRKMELYLKFGHKIKSSYQGQIVICKELV